MSTILYALAAVLVLMLVFFLYKVWDENTPFPTQDHQDWWRD